MKNQPKNFRNIALPALLVAVIGLASAVAQQPAKSSMSSAHDGFKGTEPIEVMINIEQSGSVTTPFTLPGTPGSAFLNPDWQKGVVIMHDGANIEVEHLRYNIVTQQMHFTQDDDTLAIGNPEEIKMIRIADRVFIYEQFIHQGLLKEGYLELLEEGKCRLLRRWTAAYKLLDENLQEETIYRTQTCLLQFGKEPAHEVAQNKRKFLQMFDNHNSEIRKLIKQEHLRIKDPDHLRRVIAFYNRISQ